jgi:hypothetical protein
MANPAFLSDSAAARHLAMPLGLVVRYCRQGRFVGAYFDRTTWHWRIPCPIHLATHETPRVR